MPLRIQIPAHVGSNFDGPVVRVAEADGGEGHLWKLVRTFDDPATWTEPGVRHLAANGLGGEAYRTSPLDDQWELYDLTTTRPKPSTGGRTRCWNCAATSGCIYSSRGPMPFPSATIRGRTCPVDRRPQGLRLRRKSLPQ
jgi:hypothetical protein